jgi:hypothetical protein
MDMVDAFRDDAIIQRLNVLIFLGLDAAGPGTGTSTRSKVDRLLSMGLEPAQIASIIGKPITHVTSITAKARKAARTKEKRNG